MPRDTKLTAKQRNKTTASKTTVKLSKQNSPKETTYLTNPICKLTPLFEVDYSKKQNIVSSLLLKTGAKTSL